MNIGDLNKRITIQKLITITNKNGFEEETWQDYKTVWASADNLFGREYYAAQAVQAEKTVKFTIRYCKDLDTNMRILFDNKQYNIVFIDNIKYGNAFMAIKAMEVTANG